MQQEKYALASFRSRSQAVQFLKTLQNTGIAAEIVPTPQKIALGCGLSVKFSPGELETVRKLYHQKRTQAYAGIYLVEQVGGRVRVIGAKSDFAGEL